MKGEHEVTREEMRTVETHNIWASVSQLYSNQAIPINLDLSTDDVLLVSNIVVKSLHQNSYENYVPSYMEFDPDSQVWIVSYYLLDSHGDLQLGGGMNVAIHANTLQVLMIWYDE